MNLKLLIALCLFLGLSVQQNFCPTQIYDRVKWPRTQGGQNAIGSCAPGYKTRPDGLNPLRACLPSGEWSTSVSRLCVVDDNFCGPDIYGNSAWEATYRGTISIGNCLDGYIYGPDGPPQRLCQIGGTWSADVKPYCVPSGGYCPAVTSGNAVWAKTPNGQTVSGQCQTDRGWTGKPTRTCSPGSQWLGIRNPCTAFCQRETISSGPWAGSVWKAIFSGNTQNYACAKRGGLLRSCVVNRAYNPNDPKSEPAVWGDIISRNCEM